MINEPKAESAHMLGSDRTRTPYMVARASMLLGSLRGCMTSRTASPAPRSSARESGCGIPIRGGAATGTPWAGVSLSEHRRALRLGYRVRIGESVTVGVDQTFRNDTSGDDTAHYAIMARLYIR